MKQDVRLAPTLSKVQEKLQLGFAASTCEFQTKDQPKIGPTFPQRRQRTNPGIGIYESTIVYDYLTLPTIDPAIIYDDLRFSTYQGDRHFQAALSLLRLNFPICRTSTLSAQNRLLTPLGTHPAKPPGFNQIEKQPCRAFWLILPSCVLS